MKAWKIILLLCAWPLIASAQVRTWTNTEGQSFEGLLLRFDEKEVYIERTSDKRQFSLPRTSLSAADNAYLDQRLTQQRVEEFLKDVPKTWDAGYNKCIKEDMPALVFYRGGMGQSEFDALVAKHLTDPKLQEIIKGKVFLVIIPDDDTEFEGQLGASYTAYEDYAICAIIKEYKNYTVRVWRDAEPEAFQTAIKEDLVAYDKSVY